MKNLEQITVKLGKDQKEWLYKEADRQFSSLSVLVRQAVQLLMEQSEVNEEARNRRWKGGEDG